MLRRALEDERLARAADHDEASRVLNEALTRSSSVTSELEQLRKEFDELRVGLEALEQARGATVQGRSAAIQECDLAIQERDVTIQERDVATQRSDVVLSAVEEASEREKTALSSLQSNSDPHFVAASCVLCHFMVLN